ncbi:MAG: DivIVA domain-containing protein [Acutalibacteraceae bacterium]|jgi:cell division initiation protein
MLTAENIRNAEFTRNLGGYKANEVDDFLDKCEETVASLTAEKADLTAKLNVLADKLVEYRKDEDSLRNALLDAHKMADQIVQEARDKAAAIVAEANDQYGRAKAEAQTGIAAEQAELARAKEEVAAFKAKVLQMYRDQMAAVERLPGESTAAEPPKPVSPFVEPIVPSPAEPAADEPAGPEPEEKAEEPSNSRFTDLKFGENYDIAEDVDEDEEDDGKVFFKRKK